MRNHHISHFAFSKKWSDSSGTGDPKQPRENAREKIIVFLGADDGK